MIQKEKELFENYYKNNGMRVYSHSISSTFFNEDKTNIIAENNNIINLLDKIVKENKEILLFIVHHNDLDGESSAYLISKYLHSYFKFKNVTTIYQSYNYQPNNGNESIIKTNLSKLTEFALDKAIVFIAVDLSLSKTLLEEIMYELNFKNHSYFLWIDHHSSSISTIRNRWKSNLVEYDSKYKSIPIGYIFDSRDSACYLIHSFFNKLIKDVEINEIVPALISIYDTKNNKDFPTIYQTKSLPLNTAFRELVNNFPISSNFWDYLFQKNNDIYVSGKSPLEQFINTGIGLLELQELKNSIIYNEDLIMIHKNDDIVIKGIIGNASMNLFDKDIDFCRNKAFGIFISYTKPSSELNVQYTISRPQSIKVTIVSNKFIEDIDLGDFARTFFNGGGHKHICGFNIPANLSYIKYLFKDNYIEKEISLNQDTNCIIKKDKLCCTIFSSLCKILEKEISKTTNK